MLGKMECSYRLYQHKLIAILSSLHRPTAVLITFNGNKNLFFQSRNNKDMYILTKTTFQQLKTFVFKKFLRVQ
jgi:hypothetical protein